MLLVYFIIEPDLKVNALNIFLTIVVGFLGTILGLFFSREMIEKLKTASEVKSNFITEDAVDLLQDAKDLIKENIKQKAEINRLKKGL